MPWGYECRAKLIKQNPPKPTIPKQTKNVDIPGPSEYEPARIVGGKGYSRIRRAPAYTFGLRLPIFGYKSPVHPRAPVINVEYQSKKGRYKIPGGVVGEKLTDPKVLKTPGPAAYVPHIDVALKRPPAYSMRQPPRPPYKDSDMWTPSPNMYCPPIPGKTTPAFSLGGPPRNLPPAELPGPGTHEPKFDFVKTTTPAFSFGGPHRNPVWMKTPAPNTYCEKKFKYIERRGTAPSFGIRHSPYLGKQPDYLRSSKLDLVVAAIEAEKR